MSIVNQVMGVLFNGILFPFRSLPPWVVVLVISLVAAVGMLWVFKKTSNQDRLAQVKDRIHAGLYEIRLFNDNLGQILRSQTGILRANLRYLGLSLVPMFWMIIPLVLVIAQLQSHYGYEGLRPGDTALVKVTLSDDWSDKLDLAQGAKPDIRLEAPAGLSVDTPAVWIPSLGELDWRISAKEMGDYELAVKVGEESFTKKVSVSERLGRRAPVRSAGFLDQLLYPAEPGLPGSAVVKSISVSYADAQVGIFGWGIHWLILFFVLSIAFGFALKDRFGVTI